jgi:hypothetical protein
LSFNSAVQVLRDRESYPTGGPEESAAKSPCGQIEIAASLRSSQRRGALTSCVRLTAPPSTRVIASDRMDRGNLTCDFEHQTEGFETPWASRPYRIPVSFFHQMCGALSGRSCAAACLAHSTERRTSRSSVGAHGRAPLQSKSPLFRKPVPALTVSRTLPYNPS